MDLTIVMRTRSVLRRTTLLCAFVMMGFGAMDKHAHVIYIRYLNYYATQIILAPCELFNVDCTVAGGFKVTIDDSCKQTQYSQLPADNNGIFVYASNLAENVNPDLNMIPDACVFDR